MYEVEVEAKTVKADEENQIFTKLAPPEIVLNPLESTKSYSCQSFWMPWRHLQKHVFDPSNSTMKPPPKALEGHITDQL